MRAIYATRIKVIKILTGIFYSTAIISLLFCVMVYGEEFGVGHGGVPLLVLFVSVPAVANFYLFLLPQSTNCA
jgi:hypothetical protein